MSETHASLLYDAATNALASDASSDNTYTKMVTASFPHESSASFLTELKAVEKLIKEEYKIKAMPVAWRSAKSVVLSAMRMDIALVDSNGVLLGKSAIQAAIKAGKPDVVDDVLTTMNKHLVWIENRMGDLDPVQRNRLKTKLEILAALC